MENNAVENKYVFYIIFLYLWGTNKKPIMNPKNWLGECILKNFTSQRKWLLKLSQPSYSTQSRFCGNPNKHCISCKMVPLSSVIVEIPFVCYYTRESKIPPNFFLHASTQMFQLDIVLDAHKLWTQFESLSQRFISHCLSSSAQALRLLQLLLHLH